MLSKAFNRKETTQNFFSKQYIWTNYDIRFLPGAMEEAISNTCTSQFLCSLQ